MKKYFIVSDVHGCYDELMKGLEESGYDSSNPNHIFVSLGDLFDRGNKSYECLQFVNSLSAENKILICGNHEDCLADAIVRKRFKNYDVHNKTDKTCWEFYKRIHPDAILGEVDEKQVLTWLETWEELKEYQNSLKNYYIIGNNVFVHGWVPYWCHYLTDIPKTHWTDWYDAVWEDGAQYCVKWGIKLKTTDKPNAELVTVFCGHVHSFHSNYKYHHSGEIITDFNGDINLDKIDNSPFIDEGIVNLDSYSYETKTVNVYVLEA